MNVALEGRLGVVGTSRLQRTAYWAATLLVAAEFAVGAVMDVLHLQPFFSTLLHLGYPAYFGVILGVWKVLGAITVLAPGLPRLKEWAYAGMIINLSAAIASTLVIGGGPGDLAVPFAFAGLVAVSWALRPPSRRLP
jgi:hypothetical protein